MKPIRLTIASLAVALSLALVAWAQADIYWAEPLAGAIGRSNNDGNEVENAFVHTGGQPDAVAVNSTHIYRADEMSGTIGRANVDGTRMNRNSSPGSTSPWGSR